MISRRTCLAAGLAAVSTACRKKRGDGFAGYAFVANQEGHAIAAVDLTAFAVATHIRLPAAPSSVIAHPTAPRVFALTPEAGTLHEIDSGTLKVVRTLDLGAQAVAMRPEPGGAALWVLTRGTNALVRVDTAGLAVSHRIHLPADAIDLDVVAAYVNGGWTGRGAVSHGAAGVSLIDLPKGTVRGPLPIGGEAGLARYRSDGKSLLVANRSERMLTVVDVDSGGVVVQLPLSHRPDEFCFHPDGGQLYISGEGRDAVAVIYPYYVPEVAETVLAGNRPGAMAATASHLFVTNPGAGDVTILNVDSRRVVAVAAVGTDPGCVVITPDNEYALVLNRKSGDMAVIRIAGLQPDRRKSAALFTMIPVGSRPVSAVVTPI